MQKKAKQKLSIHKTTLRMLSPQEVGKAQGGFTYSLSLGDRCQKSHDFTDGYTCKCAAAD